MKHCQLYNCTCKKCVYMNMSDKNWPNNVEFRGNFHRYAPSTPGPALPEARKLFWQLSCQIRNQQGQQTDRSMWHVKFVFAHRTVVCCLRIIFGLSTCWMHLHGVLMTFFSGFKPDAKIMGPEPCQNQPDARNTSPIPVRFWHIMAYNYLLNLLNFGHHRLVYISSAAADGLLLLYYYHYYYYIIIIIIIMTTCQGCPGYFWGPHWKPMGLREISRVTLQLWSQWHCSQYNKLLLSIKYGMHHQHASYLLHQ